MLYQLHELTRHLLAPWVHQAGANARMFSDPDSLWSTLPGADGLAAGNELFHRIGKDYEKPAWACTLLPDRRRHGAARHAVFTAAMLSRHGLQAVSPASTH